MLTTPSGSRYIGQSEDWRTRWQCHRDDARRGKGCPGVANAINKYGWENIDKQILIWCRAEDMNHFEMKFIAWYDTKKNGLNCTDGGDTSPMKEPAVVEKVLATWDRKEAERLAGASDEVWRKSIGDRCQQRQHRRDQKSGVAVDGRFQPSARRVETWARKRVLEEDQREIKRTLAEDQRLEGLSEAEKATKRHNSFKEKERKCAKAWGGPMPPDGRFAPSSKRQATWAAKLEERVAHLPPEAAAKERRKAEQRARYKAGLRAKRTE